MLNIINKVSFSEKSIIIDYSNIHVEYQYLDTDCRFIFVSEDAKLDIEGCFDTYIKNIETETIGYEPLDIEWLLLGEKYSYSKCLSELKVREISDTELEVTTDLSSYRISSTDGTKLTLDFIIRFIESEFN